MQLICYRSEGLDTGDANYTCAERFNREAEKKEKQKRGKNETEDGEIERKRNGRCT